MQCIQYSITAARCAYVCTVAALSALTVVVFSCTIGHRAHCVSSISASMLCMLLEKSDSIAIKLLLL
jgi:hypothetical protein